MTPGPGPADMAAFMATYIAARSCSNRYGPGSGETRRPTKKTPDPQFRWSRALGGRRVGLYAGENHRKATTCTNMQGGRFRGYLDGLGFPSRSMPA